MSSSAPALQFDVDAMLAGAGEQLDALLALALPAAQTAPPSTAVLAEMFWAQWRRHAGLHATVLDVCEPLRRQLATLPAAQWVTAAHPLWALLESLQLSGVGYRPELGRAGEKILGDLQRVIGLVESGGWQTAAIELQALWQQEQQRLLRLEQRLLEGERGQLRHRRAQQLAARMLNQAMAGKTLTRALVDYLQGEWLLELQWCLLQHGEQNQLWQQRALLTQRLLASLQPPGDDSEARQRLYALIPEIGAELRAVLEQRAHDSAALERQLALIEMHHLALLRGELLPASAFTLIASDDPWTANATSISRDLLRRVDELAVGQWFLLREDGNRIKLALKMDETVQLLFVNRVGVKALQKSFEEFAYLLAVDAAAPLPPAACARAILRQLLLQLARRGVEQQRVRAVAQAQEAAEAQRRAEAKAKAIAEAQTLAAAAAKAEEEALQRARSEEQSRRREAVEGESGDIAQRLRSARQTAALLPIGSWIEVHDELGRTERLKLAVKLPSSGKLIFVDRDGVRRAEFERDLFALRLVEGSARILDKGPQFEDALAKVVDGLRRDRTSRE